MKIKVKPLVYVKLVSATLYIFYTSETFYIYTFNTFQFHGQHFLKHIYFLCLLFIHILHFLYTSGIFFIYTFNIVQIHVLFLKTYIFLCLLCSIPHYICFCTFFLYIKKHFLYAHLTPF